MKIALAALLLSGLLGTARADYVIIQRVEGAMQTGTMTLKIKEAKSRADVAPELSTLTDGATGEVITLLHSKRSFMRIPAERTAALLEQMKKMQKAAKPDPAQTPHLVATGKKEKIDKAECEIFTWNANGVSATYWVDRAYPNYAAIAGAMEKSLNAGLATLSREMTPPRAEFPGMVIKTEMTIGGQKVVTTLVSVSEENVNASEFNIPAGYKETPTPEFNFPGAAK